MKVTANEVFNEDGTPVGVELNVVFESGAEAVALVAVLGGLNHRTAQAAADKTKYAKAGLVKESAVSSVPYGIFTVLDDLCVAALKREGMM